MVSRTIGAAGRSLSKATLQQANEIRGLEVFDNLCRDDAAERSVWRRLQGSQRVGFDDVETTLACDGDHLRVRVDAARGDAAVLQHGEQLTASAAQIEHVRCARKQRDIRTQPLGDRSRRFREIDPRTRRTCIVGGWGWWLGAGMGDIDSGGGCRLSASTCATARCMIAICARSSPSDSIAGCSSRCRSASCAASSRSFDLDERRDLLQEDDQRRRQTADFGRNARSRRLAVAAIA